MIYLSNKKHKSNEKIYELEFRVWIKNPFFNSFLGAINAIVVKVKSYFKKWLKELVKFYKLLFPKIV